MKRHSWIPGLAVAFAILMTARIVEATNVPNTWSYEGVLKDLSGVPVPDGDYGMLVRIYPVATGGSELLAMEFVDVPVVDGRFLVELDFDGIDLQQNLWLGFKIGSDPEMLPRTRITPSPGALGLNLPYSYDGSHTQPTLGVGNTGSGPALRVEGLLNVGTPTRTGRLSLRTSPLALPGLELGAHSSGQGGELFARDEAGNRYFEIAPHGQDAAVFRLWRNETDLGFVMEGNHAGSGAPRMVVESESTLTVFDMSEEGDASVQLFTDGVEGNEILDDPGCASAIQPGPWGLTTSLSTVASRTLTAPAAGYILAIATCEVSFQGAIPALASIVMGLTTGALLPATQTVQLTTPPGLATSESVPMTVHGLFAVSAGNTTISLRGYEANAFTTANIRDVQLSLVYFPTAYGLVASTAPDVLMAADHFAVESASEARAPLSELEIADERRRSDQLARARVERELELVRRRTAELKSQIEASFAMREAIEGGAR